MSMIDVVNEAINRKLNSINFTDVIIGTVESVNPLQIRINNRIVIGQNFIEPMSLGISDYSPNSALPLIVGEKVQMIRYNRGQRFYILGKDVDYVKTYPIGTVYSNMIDINPEEYFGGDWQYIGTSIINGETIHNWVRMKEADGRLLLESGMDLLLENGRRIVLEDGEE